MARFFSASFYVSILLTASLATWFFHIRWRLLGDSFDRDKSGPSETGAQLVERVKGFLEKRGNNARPLFLFLHSYAVHNYYDVRPEIAANFPNTDFMPRKEYVHCALGRKDCDPKAWREMKRLYRAELDDFDVAFASLANTLTPNVPAPGTVNVYLHDRLDGSTSILSSRSDGQGEDGSWSDNAWG